MRNARGADYCEDSLLLSFINALDGLIFIMSRLRIALSLSDKVWKAEEHHLHSKKHRLQVQCDSYEYNF